MRNVVLALASSELSQYLKRKVTCYDMTIITSKAPRPNFATVDEVQIEASVILLWSLFTNERRGDRPSRGLGEMRKFFKRDTCIRYVSV